MEHTCPQVLPADAQGASSHCLICMAERLIRPRKEGQGIKTARPKCRHNSHSHNLGNESVGPDWHGVGRKGRACWPMKNGGPRLQMHVSALVGGDGARRRHRA